MKKMRRNVFCVWSCRTCLVGVLAGLLGHGAAWASGFAVNINFQPATAANVTGYLPDVGYAFSDRGNGYAYGWNVDNTANVFQRNLYSDERIDTGNKMQPGGQSLYWQIEVPDGCYDVLLVAADPADKGGNGTCYSISAEGTPIMTNGVPTSSQWIFGTNAHVQVWVGNRRLTISNGVNATNNSICYIQIQQVAPIFWGAGIIDNTGTNKAPWDYNSPTDPGVLGYHESNTVKRLSIVGWGDTWSNASISSYNLFTWNTNVSGMSGMWARGTIPFYTWQPSAEPTDTTNFSLQNIIAGEQDSYITTWARAAKAYGKPFFLRFAHEMNGTWYPWSEGIGVSSNAPPGSFTNMWQHVHNIFTSVGCTNATWIWCVNEVDSADLPGDIAQFYPGDNYVDWLGMDAYNMNNSPPGQSFETIFGVTYSNLTTLSPSKPIMICETATLDGGAPPGNSKPAWISDALSMLPTTFPNVRAFVWYNVNNTDGDDYPIEGGENSDPYWTAPIDSNSVAAWANGIASPFYESNIFTNQANLTASPIQPIVLLSPPSTLVAAASNATVRLSWTGVAGATNYNIYRSTSSSNGTFAWLTNSAATNCTDATSTFGMTYYYEVAAQNLAGESLNSPQASVTAPRPMLTVQMTTTKTLLLSWPVGFGGFVLQSNANLQSANWGNVTASTNVANGQNQVNISPLNATQFYRLELP